MTIFNIYSSQLGEQQFDAIAQNIGATTAQTVQGSNQIVPLMISAMARISRSDAGAQGVYDLITSEHDGSVLRQLPNLYANPTQFPGDLAFSRLLGDRRDDAAQYVSDDTGMSMASSQKLIGISSSILLGMMGGMMRQQKTDKAMLASTLNDFAAMHERQESGEEPVAAAAPEQGGGGLFSSMLGMAGMSGLGNIGAMLQGGGKGGIMKMVTGLLDRNRDGSVIDDLMGMAGGFLANRK